MLFYIDMSVYFTLFKYFCLALILHFSNPKCDAKNPANATLALCPGL